MISFARIYLIQQRIHSMRSIIELREIKSKKSDENSFNT